MTYKVLLTPKETGYQVACPELPECRSQGRTEEEALANIRSAILAHLNSLGNEESTKLVRYVEVPPFSRSLKATLPPFKVKSKPLGLPKEWTSGKTEDLLDILEGPDRKW